MGLCSKQVSSDGIDWGENFKLHSSGLIDVPKRKQTQNHQPDPLPCPRCESKNTKFCYYNNYNKSQPRHFCKACKRHWTKGGTLRNVPVGGGRKNKRLKSTTTSTTSLAVDSQSRQQTKNLSLALGDQKDVFGILSQGLFGNRGNNVNSSFLGNPSALPLFQNQMPQVTFSNLGLFEIDSTSSLNSDNILVGLGSLTDTNMIMPPTTWQAQLTSNDAPGYWNWDEVDPLVSADQLNLCWDDNHDIKH